MDQRLPDPAVAAPPDWRGLCEELLRELENAIAVHYGEGGTHHISAADAVIAKADAALAQPEPEVVGPTRRQLMLLADDMDMASVSDAAEYARAVLARWGNYPVKPDSSAPAPVGERQAAPVPVASDVYFEFVVSDADYCEQAGGTAPSYAQAVSEGQRYLAQYQQDGPHSLEVRRVENLNPGAFPVPDDAPLPVLPEDAQVIEPSEHTILVPVPVPVAVSDRLPQPEDCDAEGQVWAWDYLAERWGLWPHESIADGFYHWLPAHALPLPSGEAKA